jgi:hypothetical protein
VRHGARDGTSILFQRVDQLGVSVTVIVNIDNYVSEVRHGASILFQLGVSVSDRLTL